MQDVLVRLDAFLDVPVVLIGYGMIRRSLSVRSAHRVPTHIICAPSGGISLADVVQMWGRGMGNRYGAFGNRVLSAVCARARSQNRILNRNMPACGST